jgi:hypothetical protein
VLKETICTDVILADRVAQFLGEIFGERLRKRAQIDSYGC